MQQGKPNLTAKIVLAGLVLGMVFVLSLMVGRIDLFGSPAAAANIGLGTKLPNGATVIKDNYHDVSKPMRDIPDDPGTTPKSDHVIENLWVPFKAPKDRITDPVLQKFFGKLSMPGTITGFEG